MTHVIRGAGEDDPPGLVVALARVAEAAVQLPAGAVERLVDLASV